MSQICTSIKTRTKMRLEWDNEGQSLSVDVWMKVMFADKSATFVWRCSNVVTCQVKDQQRRHLLLVNEQVYTETLGTFLIPPIESGFDDDEVTIMKIFTEQRLLKLSSRRDSVMWPEKNVWLKFKTVISNKAPFCKAVWFFFMVPFYLHPQH